MCMANTILKQVNDVGAKLGYPFYVYPDGTCGKSIVSGKMNAIGIVKKKFPVQELKSEFLCDAFENEEILAHLSHIGENIGFPFYVYANGSCGTTSSSQAYKLPVAMCVKKKFPVDKLVFDINKTSTQNYQRNAGEGLKIEDSLDDVSETSIGNERLDIEAELLRLEKCSDDVIKTYFEQNQLSEAELRLMFEKCSDDVIKAYFEKHKLYESVEKVMLEKCSDEVIKAYFEKHSLYVSAEKVMLENCSDEVIKAYFREYPLCDTVEHMMIENCSDEVIAYYRKKYGIAKSVWSVMRKRYGIFWLLST